MVRDKLNLIPSIIFILLHILTKMIQKEINILINNIKNLIILQYNFMIYI